eukprot:TRINITY_DN38706_c0_g1_i1.p1 TRINITY_DN38706_c0_g1~~TRINITY_DN38706_c0_g1_i1.p1  ORF type:complete len:150 (+),score=35.03 TRINITY_DN38706_c0_g1_i1:77-526(+)
MFSCCANTSSADAEVVQDSFVAVEEDNKDIAATFGALKSKAAEPAKTEALEPSPVTASAESGPFVFDVTVQPGKVGLKLGERTLRVVEIVDGGAFAAYNRSCTDEKRKVKVGDVIAMVNGESVNPQKMLELIQDNVKSGKSHSLQFKRA